MFRKDLAAAREAWIAEAKSDADKESRKKSDFLEYRNAAGEVVDFHALGTRTLAALWPAARA